MKLAIAAVFVLATGCLSGPTRADLDGGTNDDGGGVSDGGGATDAGVATLSPLRVASDGNQHTVFNDLYSVTIAGPTLADGYTVESVRIPFVGSDELVLTEALAPGGFLEFLGGVLQFDVGASHQATDAEVTFERGLGVTVQFTVQWSVGPISSGISRYSFYPDGRVIRAEYVDATVAEAEWLLAYVALNPQHFSNLVGSDGLSFDHGDAVTMGPAPTMIPQGDSTWVCATTPNSYRIGWASRFADDTAPGSSGVRATFNVVGSQVATAALQTDWVRSRPQPASPNFMGRAAEIYMDFGQAGSDATCSGFARFAQEFLSPAMMTVQQGSSAMYDSERDLYRIDALAASTVQFTLSDPVSRLSLAVVDMPGTTYTVTLGGRTLVAGIDYLAEYERDTQNSIDNAWLVVATPIAAGEALVMTAAP